MTRREFMAGTAAAAAAPARRPNFIVFLTDDHGSADLGCQGARDLKTPNIDALAASGARFTNWYSNAPVCAPARGALMTGRYPQRNGVITNGTPLRPSEKTIAEWLKPHGYRTAITGKWHLGSDPDTVPNAHGFDHFFGFHSGCVDFYSHRYYWGEPRRVNYHDLWRNREEVFEDGQYLTELIAREACNWLQAQPRQPFFLYVPFNAVHYPMHAPRKYLERFPASMDPERRMYAAMLAAADDAVGQILGTVKKMGQLDNTMVFFQADNGATKEPRAGLGGKIAKGGSNGVFRGEKFSLFDGGMHVPGILSWPGKVPAGQVRHEVGMAVDILPTILAAAGVPLPQDRTLDGRDILGKLRHEAIFWGSGGQLAVRRRNWKLVKNGSITGPDGSRKRLEGDDALFLSDLEKDPGETKNLRHANPAVLDEMLTLLNNWQEQVKTN
ncbi:MAG: sulfatase-like hydrolase/transferase [Bryobacteraceae bacterium]